MKTQAQVSTSKVQSSVPVCFPAQPKQTHLVAHWLKDKEGHLFQCWVKEAIAD